MSLKTSAKECTLSHVQILPIQMSDACTIVHVSLENMKTLLDFPISTLQALCAVIIQNVR